MPGNLLSEKGSLLPALKLTTPKTPLVIMISQINLSCHLSTTLLAVSTVVLLMSPIATYILRKKAPTAIFIIVIDKA
jgi:hypothetical protein